MTTSMITHVSTDVLTIGLVITSGYQSSTSSGIMRNVLKGRELGFEYQWCVNDGYINQIGQVPKSMQLNAIFHEH